MDSLHTESNVIDSQENLNNTTSKKETFKEMLSTCIYSIIIAFTFITFVNITFVSGNSMDPTLKDRDILFMEKASVMFNNLEAGDIVSFRQQNGKDRTAFFIKRIIGVPGNTVEIKDGKVYVNESLIDEEYLPENLETLTPDGEDLRVLLDGDEYFVLGDNRNNSLDSRFPEVGVVNKKQIISKKLFKIFNLPKLN